MAAYGDADDFGLDANEIRSVARRQLVASLVVALVIAAATGLAALRPAPHGLGSASASGFAAVQQPAFVTPPGRRVATSSKEDQIELP